MEPALPAALIGRFEVQRVLRADEWLHVFCVKPLTGESTEPVTLKVLHGDGAAADALATEFALLHGIGHPNLTRILEYGRDGSTCWLVREFVEGDTLAEAGPGLSPEHRRAVLIDLLRGLSHLHGLGLLHLDLKPENVLLRRGAARPEAVLTDFGFAATVAGHRTAAVRGTPPFIAPEVLLGLERDARADLFSLGVTWLAASPAAPDLSPARVYERFPAVGFVDALALDLTTVDPEFAPLLERLLALDPRDRPVSAAALLAELHDEALDPRALAPLLRPQPPCARGEALEPACASARGDAPGAVLWCVAGSDADVRAAEERLRFTAARAGTAWVAFDVADVEPTDGSSPGASSARAGRLVTWAREITTRARGGCVLARIDGASALVPDALAVVGTLARIVASTRQCALVVLGAPWAATGVDAAALREVFGEPRVLEVLDAPALAEHLARLEGVALDGAARDRLTRVAQRITAVAGADADQIDAVLRDALESGAIRAAGGRVEFSALANATLRAPNAGALVVDLEPAACAVLALAHLCGRTLATPVAAALLEPAERAALPTLTRRRLLRVHADGSLALAAPAIGVAALARFDATRLAARWLDAKLASRDVWTTVRCLAFAGREDELARFVAEQTAAAHAAPSNVVLAACAEASPFVHTEAARDALAEWEVDAAIRHGALERAHQRLSELVQRKSPPLVAIDRLRRLGGVEVLRGRAEDAERDFESAIQCAKKPGTKLDVDSRAELERSHAYARFLRGDVGGAHRLLETTLRERRGLRPATRARVLTLLGSLALRAGRSGRAREALDEALALATDAGDDELVATAQTNRATLFLREGRLADAEHALLAARPLRVRLGHAWEEAALANNLGLVLRDLGRLDDAKAALDEALRLRRTMGDVAGEAGTLANLGAVLELSGALRDALDALDRAEPIFERLHQGAEVALCRLRRATTWLRLCDVGRAGAELDAVDATSAPPRIRAEAALARAELAACLGDDERAGREVGVAEREFESAADVIGASRAKLLRARLLRQAGDPAGARKLVRRLGELVPRLAPAVAIEEARATIALEAVEEAAKLLFEARDEARRMGLVVERAVAIAELVVLLKAVAPSRAAAVAAELRPALRSIALPTPVAERPAQDVWRELLGKPLANALDMDQEPTAEHPLAAGRVTTEGIPDEVFRTFVAINRSVLRETDRDRLLERLVEYAVALTGARRGYLVMLRAGQVEFESRAGDIGAGADEVSRSIVLDAIKQRRPLVTANARADTRLQGRRSIEDFDLRSVLCVPFQTEAGIEGAIYVDNPVREGMFSTRSIDLLEALAGQAAIAIGNLEHRAQVESLNTDLEKRVQLRERELREARRALDGKPTVESGMVAESESMRQLLRLADRVAASDLPILIRGDSGTGKEVLARRIHASSPRASRAFVAENCSAVPETLLESEFFGYTKGAFTGADHDHDGLFVQADGGTLFLDEIGDMPASLQAKLLRALQEKAVRPLGSTRSLAIDVRLVCATHRNLEEMVQSGAFREDLYYRIRGATLTLAPLRERSEDVAPLARVFLDRLNARYGTKRTMTAPLLRRLVHHDWPGNVRELESEVTRLYHLATGDVIDEADFDPKPRAVPDLEGRAVVRVKPIDVIEKEAIELALRDCGGNREEAARRLHISRAAFYVKLKKYELAQSSPSSRSPRKPS
ncbi:MAG: sigma 54-interacting transcriptional regulator [Planctomycetes bacterium]|nr:sigma 54-interacting transcriptional regulator [Planctomycetota bacterium]